MSEPLIEMKRLAAWAWLVNQDGQLQKVQFGREEGVSRARREANIAAAIDSDICSLLGKLECGIANLPQPAIARDLLALLRRVEALRAEEIGRRSIAVAVLEALANRAPE